MVIIDFCCAAKHMHLQLLSNWRGSNRYVPSLIMYRVKRKAKESHLSYFAPKVKKKRSRSNEKDKLTLTDVLFLQYCWDSILSSHGALLLSTQEMSESGAKNVCDDFKESLFLFSWCRGSSTLFCSPRESSVSSIGGRMAANLVSRFSSLMEATRGGFYFDPTLGSHLSQATLSAIFSDEVNLVESTDGQSSENR